MGTANAGSTDTSEPPAPNDQTSRASGVEKQPRIAGRLASRLSEWLDALRARQPSADREMLAVLAVAMVLFSVFPVANFLLGRFAMDYDLWYTTAQCYLHHQPIYPASGEFDFIYPPSAAAMLSIPAVLGRPGFVLALVALNSLAWVSCAKLTVWLVTGQSARQHPLLTLLPSLAMIFWIWDTYLLGQPALVLLALMLGAAACFRLGRPAFAGVMVGTAAAIKAFPILAVGYLVYRREWKATAVTVATLAGWLLAVPLVFRSPEMAGRDLTSWSRGVLLTYDAHGISQRPIRGFSFRNQSIVGVANRLLRPVPADGQADPRWTVNVATLDFPAVNAVIIVVMLGLGIFFLWCMPRRSARTSPEESIEWAMVLLLVTLAPPLSFNYGFVWMLYPLGVATQLMLGAAPDSQRRQRITAWLASSLLVQAMALPMRRVAQAYGSTFFSAFILLLGLGLTLRQMASKQGTAPAPLPRPS